MRVQIVGHSQVPEGFVSYDDVQVDVYSKSGARLHHVQTSPELKDSLEQEVDLTILFIGGNDVFSLTPTQIYRKIWDLVELYRRHSRAVRVCALEPREYWRSRRSVWRQRAELYNTNSDLINKRLTRKAKTQKRYRVVNFTQVQFRNHSGDGVHYYPLDQVFLIRRFKTVIKNVREELNIPTVQQ